MTTDLQTVRDDALAIFNAGLHAVAPAAAIARNCRREGDVLSIGARTFNLNDYTDIYLVGAGKATAAMAGAVEALVEDRLQDGVIVVKYGHTTPLKKVTTIEAGHPVPDQQGERGAGQVIEMVRRAGPHDLCLCLISGGGSALLPYTVAGVSLAAKQEMTRILLACGATIHEINALRKHLSLIKGGQLAAAAAPATIISLMISDVVGDDLDVIASGPTVPDHSTFDDCMAIIDKYGIADKLPPAVVEHLARGTAGDIPETPKSGDPAFQNAYNLIVARNRDALYGAAREAANRGYQPLILSAVMEGETREVARVHTAIAREVLQSGHPVASPACILSGGETTVTLRGRGKGGRNQEFALWVVGDIAGLPEMVILSAGTDGTDGPTDAAGALVDNTSLERAVRLDLDIELFQANNDAYHFFAPLNDLVITGPTQTNVMDLRLILIPGESPASAKMGIL